VHNGTIEYVRAYVDVCVCVGVGLFCAWVLRPKSKERSFVEQRSHDRSRVSVLFIQLPSSPRLELKCKDWYLKWINILFMN